jgi:hypothetical protein
MTIYGTVINQSHEAKIELITKAIGIIKNKNSLRMLQFQFVIIN